MNKYKSINYTNEPISLGKRVKDFLPSPEELADKPSGIKVTITLSKESVEFFKHEAKQLKTPYQRMIRNLIDQYVKQVAK